MLQDLVLSLFEKRNGLWLAWTGLGLGHCLWQGFGHILTSVAGGGGWWLATVIPWSQASGDVCSACSAYSPKLDHTYLTASQSDYATTKHRLVRNLPKNASVMSSRPPSHSWWKSLSPKLSGQVQWDHICRLIAKSRVWDEASYLAPHSIYATQSDVTVLLLIERPSSSNRIALWNARSKPSL